MRFLLFVFKKVLTSTKFCSFLVLGDTKFKIEGYLFRQNNQIKQAYFVFLPKYLFK